MLKAKLTLLTAALLLTAWSVQAIQFVGSQTFTVGEDSVLTQEVWVAAEETSISGTVSNDLFCATEKLTGLKGTFYGDVWSIGNRIDLSGEVYDDARLISGKIIQLSGTVHGSLIAAGSTVKIDPTAILNKDCFFVGESVIAEGTNRGSVHIIGQRVTVSGQIDGDLSITAGDISILPGTVLNSDLNYTAPKELILPPSVILNGKLNRVFNEPPAATFFKKNLTTHFTFALGALMAGLAFTALFPGFSGKTVHLLRHAAGFCAVTGFAAVFLIPMIAGILIVTVIGIPLGALLFLFYLILLYLSKIVVAIWIGTLLLKTGSPAGQSIAAPLALGLFLIYTLTCLTIAGFILNLTIMIFGVGALLTALFKKPVIVIQSPHQPEEVQKEK